MKKLLLIFPLIAIALAACNEDEDSLDNYVEWLEANNNWLNEQANLRNQDGSPYYTKLTSEWNSNAYVLIHYFNDRKLTEGNLSPLYTSTIAVKYAGRLYDNTPFDSSYKQTDSLYVAQLSDNISGWWIALSDMRVGDSATVVIPAAQAYGTASMGSVPPFSVLQFDIKLVDIPHYQDKR